VSTEDIAQRVDDLVAQVDRLKAQRSPLQPLPLAPRLRTDWPLFLIGIMVGLLVASLGLLLNAACKCPAGWIP
jgi:hypothetical protein